MKRDPTIDSMRGLLVVYMFAVHLMMSPFRTLAWVRRFSDFPFGWIPVAGGFIFISGVVIGLGYGHLYKKRGDEALRRASRKQALEIYLTHVGTFAAVFAGSLMWPQMVAGLDRLAAMAQSPGRSFVLGAALLLQPDFFDILPMYCLYLLITPAVLSAFGRGRAPTALAVSAGVWLASQLGLDALLRDAVEHVQGASLGLFDPLAWQVIFVFGLYFGYRRTDGEVLARISPERRRALAIVAGAVALAFFVIRWELLAPTPDALLAHMWRRKAVFPPLMALNFAAFAYLLALAMKRRPRVFTWRWLGFVGKHPLICFSFHLIIVSYLTIWWEPIAALPEPAGFALLALVVFTVTAPAAVEEWWQQRRKRAAAGKSAGGV